MARVKILIQIQGENYIAWADGQMPEDFITDAASGLGRDDLIAQFIAPAFVSACQQYRDNSGLTPAASASPKVSASEPVRNQKHPDKRQQFSKGKRL